MQAVSDKASCPKCGKVGLLLPVPSVPWRVQLICNCNPTGAVLEKDANPPDRTKQRKETKK
jgi:hypothetical protein